MDCKIICSEKFYKRVLTFIGLNFLQIKLGFTFYKQALLKPLKQYYFSTEGGISFVFQKWGCTMCIYSSSIVLPLKIPKVMLKVSVSLYCSDNLIV